MEMLDIKILLKQSETKMKLLCILPKYQGYVEEQIIVKKTVFQQNYFSVNFFKNYRMQHSFCNVINIFSIVKSLCNAQDS